MSEEFAPVSPRDLRAALALCKAKFEVESAYYRELASMQAPGAYHAQGVTTKEHAESLERMAAQVGAMLRAPDIGPLAECAAIISDMKTTPRDSWTHMSVAGHFAALLSQKYAGLSRPLFLEACGAE